MHMSVKYNGNKYFDKLEGKLIAILDVYGKLIEEELPFFGCYFEEIVSIYTK